MISSIITFIVFLEISSCINVNLQPNRYWTCDYCEVSRKSYVYGLIHRAIHKEQRNVYFILDMSWVDKILYPTSSVRVTNVTYDRLESYQPLSLDNKDSFDIIYSEIPKSNMFSHRYPGLTLVDYFLAQNPCWTVLREPIDLDQSISTSLTQNSKVNNVRMDVFQRSVILIRLPETQFSDTCKLFTAIHKRQFPSKCTKHLYVHCVGNIGWGNTFNGVLFYLAIALRSPQDILIIPDVHNFRFDHRTITIMNTTTGGNDSVPYRGWQWSSSDPKNCLRELDAFDPWACNFIPVSNCTKNEVAKFNPKCPTEDITKVWYTPMEFLLSLGIDEKSRTLNHDAPQHSQELWIYTRLTAYLQRPNSRMRGLIRKSISKLEPVIVPMVTSASSSTSSTNKQPRDISHFDVLTSSSTSSGSGSSTSNSIMSSSMNKRKKAMSGGAGATSLKPCLTMHIRHGDLLMDGRGSLPIDRSLPNFVRHTYNLTQALGIHTIFLASDNATAITTAPLQFPEYHWMTQKRPIKKHIHMFEVNNEKDLQVELSHVLAELIIATKCSAMVACFDSGFSELIFLTMCANSAEGTCPPSADLRDPYLVRLTK